MRTNTKIVKRFILKVYCQMYIYYIIYILRDIIIKNYKNVKTLKRINKYIRGRFQNIGHRSVGAK